MPGSLGAAADTLTPIIEAWVRVTGGVALVPHGLRVTFGFFRGSGGPAGNLKALTAQLDRDGYRPGAVWAPLISATELVAGPLFALGLFTRVAAVPIVLFLAVSCWERWHKGGWFWNKQGLEYTLLWTIAAAYFLAEGGGVYSLDHLLGL